MSLSPAHKWSHCVSICLYQHSFVTHTLVLKFWLLNGKDQSSTRSFWSFVTGLSTRHHFLIIFSVPANFSHPSIALKNVSLRVCILPVGKHTLTFIAGYRSLWSEVSFCFEVVSKQLWDGNDRNFTTGIKILVKLPRNGSEGGGGAGRKRSYEQWCWKRSSCVSRNNSALDMNGLSSKTIGKNMLSDNIEMSLSLHLQCRQ